MALKRETTSNSTRPSQTSNTISQGTKLLYNERNVRGYVSMNAAEALLDVNGYHKDSISETMEEVTVDVSLRECLENAGQVTFRRILEDIEDAGGETSANAVLRHMESADTKAKWAEVASDHADVIRNLLE